MSKKILIRTSIISISTLNVSRELYSFLKMPDAVLKTGEGPSGETFGVIRNTFMKLTKEQIVHNYGRIDDHPTQSKNRQIEMALMRRDTDQTYHFHLALRKQEYFAWPAQPLIEAIQHITLQLQHLSKDRKNRL